MLIFKWQANSSSNLASFFIVTWHNFSVNFKHIHFLLWTKGSCQNPNFDTFKCSDQNLPNFSCHFSNQKSVFLQILHKSSVSWKITHLYCFSSNLYTLVTRSQTFECSSQNSWNSLSQVYNDKSIPLQFLYHSWLSWHITLL